MLFLFWSSLPQFPQLKSKSLNHLDSLDAHIGTQTDRRSLKPVRVYLSVHCTLPRIAVISVSGPEDPSSNQSYLCCAWPFFFSSPTLAFFCLSTFAALACSYFLVASLFSLPLYYSFCIHHIFSSYFFFSSFPLICDFLCTVCSSTRWKSNR